MKNCKGYSLVELVTVIAIMAVLTGLITISVSAVSGFKATECAKNIESQLNKARVDTMANSSMVLRFFKGADEAYYVEITSTDGLGTTKTVTELVGKKSVSVTYSVNEDGSSPQALVAGNDFKISFNRSSGALAATETGLVQVISVTQGHRTVVIRIYPETGKVSVEK